MRRLLLVLTLLCASLYSSSAQTKFGLSVGYVPTWTDCFNLGRFDSFSLGVPMKWDMDEHLFLALRPEAVIGTKLAKGSLLYTVQYNLPSLSLPVLVGYSFTPLDFLRVEPYAGMKLRYGGLSFTPTHGELVLKYDYPSADWQMVCAGFCLGVSLADIVNSPHTSFSLEYTGFFIARSYPYYLQSLALNYTYWF